MRSFLPVLLLLISVSACTPGTADNPDTDIPFRNIGLDVDFIGDDVCFDCHESEWEGFQTHGMSQSFYTMSPEREVEDYTADAVYHEQSNFYYQPLRNGDEYFQEEYRLDEAGQKTHSLIRKIDFVLGSGNAARTYITVNNGRLHELPLTWFSQGVGWAMSPGYERENVRFDRTLTDRCISCHNAFPEKEPFVPGKFHDVPEGISCERCHGPGALHVDERLAEFTPPDSIDTSIVNPAHLELAGQLDVCEQCHTTGAVTVLKEGRGDFDFRPGEPLSSHISIFEEKTPDSGNKIVVVSHADRLKLSACFIQTEKTPEPLTCVTCHDPHDGFRDKGPEYFNSTCISCHEGIESQFASEPLRTDHSGTATCFSCHMPSVKAENAPHASFTDHWIRSSTDSISVAATAVTRRELLPMFEADASTPVEKGIAYLIHGEQKAGSSSIQLLDQALAEDPNHAEAQFLYGRALLKTGRVEDAINALEKARELEPDNPEILQELGWVYEIDSRPELVSEQLYREALKVQPANAEIRVMLAQLLESGGRLDAARNEYTLAIAENPWLTSAHYGLGTASLTLQQIDDAEASFKRAVELDPDFGNALANLGAVYILKQNLTEAAVLFERALAVDPTNVAAAGNLGLVYAQLGDYTKARDWLQHVLVLSPRDERARAALEEVKRLRDQ